MTENVQSGKEGPRRACARSPWIVLAGLVGLYALLYAPTLAGATFLGDDWFHIERVPGERIPRLFFGDWHQGYRLPVGGFYRPLPRILMQFGRVCFNSWTMGFLLVSAALHVFNCLLVWLAAMRLTDRPTVAWPAAVLFAIYPTHPEALLQVSTLADPMATCGCLIALVGYLAVRESGAVRGWLVAGTGVLFAALCKESWGALPLALLLLECVWPGRERYVPARKAWARVAPFFLFGVIYVVFRHIALGGVGGYGMDLTLETVRQTYDATFRLVLLPFVEIEMTDLVNALSLGGGMMIIWALLSFPRLLLYATGWMVLMTLPLMTLGPRLHDGGRLVYIIVVGLALFAGGTFDALVRAGRTAGARRTIGVLIGLPFAIGLVVAQQYNCADWRRSFRVNRRLVAEMVEVAVRHPDAGRYAILQWPSQYGAAQSNRPESAAKTLAMLTGIDPDRIEARLAPDAPPETVTFAVDKTFRLHSGHVEGVEKWIWTGARLNKWRPEGNARLSHVRGDGSRDYEFDDSDAVLAGPEVQGGTGYYCFLVRYELIRGDFRGNWGFVMWRHRQDAWYEPSQMATLVLQARLGEDAKLANPGWLSSLRDMLFIPAIDGCTITIRAIEIVRFDILPL